MTSRTLAALTAADGSAPLPRKNGELVFEAPWQSRAFGVAVALHEAGAMDFEVFRSQLIVEIAEHAKQSEGEGEGAYYECWLETLERVLLEGELVSASELDTRRTAIAHAWAHDHEHLHGHDHHHENGRAAGG